MLEIGSWRHRLYQSVSECRTRKSGSQQECAWEHCYVNHTFVSVGQKSTCEASMDYRRKNAGRQIRHNSINDIVWRVMRRAGIASIKEPLGLLRDDGKRPDGVTMIPWSRGRCVPWAVPGTFAAIHLPLTSITPSATADRAVTNKKMKYQLLTQTHTFTPLAVETTAAFNTEASKFLQDIGRRCTEATGDIKETAYLFQPVSVSIQRGNALSIRSTLFSAT